VLPPAPPCSEKQVLLPHAVVAATGPWASASARCTSAPARARGPTRSPKDSGRGVQCTARGVPAGPIPMSGTGTPASLWLAWVPAASPGVPPRITELATLRAQPAFKRDASRTTTQRGSLRWACGGTTISSIIASSNMEASMACVMPRGTSRPQMAVALGSGKCALTKSMIGFDMPPRARMARSKGGTQPKPGP